MLGSIKLPQIEAMREELEVKDAQLHEVLSSSEDDERRGEFEGLQMRLQVSTFLLPVFGRPAAEGAVAHAERGA